MYYQYRRVMYTITEAIAGALETTNAKQEGRTALHTIYSYAFVRQEQLHTCM
jgi:hypothetical protein